MRNLRNCWKKVCEEYPYEKRSGCSDATPEPYYSVYCNAAGLRTVDTEIVDLTEDNT